MEKATRELYETSDDIIYLTYTGTKLGWKNLKPQSIHRILYLSKILYFFLHKSDDNVMAYYHFSTENKPGPVSAIIEKALDFLESIQFIHVDSSVNLNTEKSKDRIDRILNSQINKNKFNWLKVIMLILSKYGENKVFSFTINDPQYIESSSSNSPKEITFNIEENKTLEVLNNFKEAFEESIDDTSSISKEEYLDLYFEYIFSEIIK